MHLEQLYKQRKSGKNIIGLECIRLNIIMTVI